MKTTLYSVTAYRFGNRQRHSYIVGIYSSKTKALNAANVEEDYRGGKYNCEVIQVDLDNGIEGSNDITHKVVKELEELL